MSTTTYRTCPRSGLQFEANAEKLMIANAVAAVVFLLHRRHPRHRRGAHALAGDPLARRPTPSTWCSPPTASTC